MFQEGRLDQPNHTLKKRSLLRKYEIPIDHISFEYIEVCKDVKELERILRVLRSGEEGFYPQLQAKAEERLRALSPNSQQLRVEEPVLTRSDMSSDQWNSINSDISSWKKEMSLKDLRLSEENNNSVAEEFTLPPVRNPFKTKSDETASGTTSVPVRTKAVSDYSTWDKYDADTELLKMDLEEEKKREKLKKKEQEAKRKVETDRLELIVKEAEKLSDTEREVLAEQEKNRGNEYYQAKEFVEAIKYYTASVAIWPTAKAYNNRAACYLKQCKYSAALADANSTLAIEPDNVKALFRRALALQHKNQFREALADMKAILAKEPRHVLSRHIAQDLQEQIKTLPRKVRIMTDEGYKKPKKIEEIYTTKPFRKNYNYSSNRYEVNERGLPKVMCECSGRPSFLQQAPCSMGPPSPPRQTPARIVELSDDAAPPSDSTELQQAPCSVGPPSPPRQTPARIVELSDDVAPLSDSTELQQAPCSVGPPSLPRQTPARIVELSDDVSPPTNSTKLKIVEVDYSDQVDKFYKGKECFVIDKRTKKIVVNGNLNCLNNEKKLINSDFSQGSSCGSGDSGMDEDFDINPLLDDVAEPLLQTNL